MKLHGEHFLFESYSIVEMEISCRVHIVCVLKMYGKLKFFFLISILDDRDTSFNVSSYQYFMFQKISHDAIFKNIIDMFGVQSLIHFTNTCFSNPSSHAHPLFALSLQISCYDVFYHYVNTCINMYHILQDFFSTNLQFTYYKYSTIFFIQDLPVTHEMDQNHKG